MMGYKTAVVMCNTTSPPASFLVVSKLLKLLKYSDSLIIAGAFESCQYCITKDVPRLTLEFSVLKSTEVKVEQFNVRKKLSTAWNVPLYIFLKRVTNWRLVCSTGCVIATITKNSQSLYQYKCVKLKPASHKSHFYEEQRFFKVKPVINKELK